MLPSSIRNHLLVDEGQLGQRLNSDLHHGDRADFRLYLALLTAAVEEQPWFDAKPAASLGSRDWRLHFDLRQAEVLVAEGAGSDCSAINERLQQGGGGKHGGCAALTGAAIAAAGAGALARKAGRYTTAGRSADTIADPRPFARGGGYPIALAQLMALVPWSKAAHVG